MRGHRAEHLLLWGMALALVSGCGHARPTAEEPAAAGLTLEPSEIDLGKVFLGMSPRFQAELVNQSPSEVEIKEITTTCGCMNVVSDKKCPAGGRIALTGGLRPVSELGPFRHSVTVTQAGHEDQPLVLELVGTVEAQIQVSDRTVILRPDCLAGKAGEAAFRIKNASAATVHLQKPVGLPDGVAATLDKAELKPGEEGRVTVRALPDQFTDSDFDLRVPTSHPREIAVAVRVALRPETGVTIAPRAIRLGVVQRKQLLDGKGFTIKVAGKALPALAVKAVKLPAYLRLSGQDSEGAEGVRLRFSFVDTFAGIDLADEIGLELQSRERSGGLRPKRFGVQIPITGMVRGD